MAELREPAPDPVAVRRPAAVPVHLPNRFLCQRRIYNVHYLGLVDLEISAVYLLRLNHIRFITVCSFIAAVVAEFTAVFVFIVALLSLPVGIAFHI